jgi:urate oxidase
MSDPVDVRLTHSYSLQEVLYAIGGALIEALPSACEVRLALPNKHHDMIDPIPFGLENKREVYLAGDRLNGLIEGTIPTDDAPDAGLAWA